MTGRKDEHLENVRGIQGELLGLLEGMDYCLDWKPDSASWSARQVVYHLLDTPPGGFHQVLWGVLTGELDEFELWSDLDNITPERTGYDLDQILEDLRGFFERMEQALALAAEEDLEQKSVLVHQRNRGWDEPKSAQNLLEGLFARHWREHLAQVLELREGLGM